MNKGLTNRILFLSGHISTNPLFASEQSLLFKRQLRLFLLKKQQQKT